MRNWMPIIFSLKIVILGYFVLSLNRLGAEEKRPGDHRVVIAGEVDFSTELARHVSAIKAIVEKEKLKPDNFFQKAEESQELRNLLSQTQRIVSGIGIGRDNPEVVKQTILTEVFGPEAISPKNAEDREGESDETPEEKRAREAAEERAAREAAGRRGALRDVEDELERREREKELERLEQARGQNSGGESSEGGGGSEPSSPPPSSANNSNENANQNNAPNNAIDRLADRLGGLSQPNFDSPTNQNKKSEPEKPKFSLEPSKSSLDKESAESSKPKLTKPSLPELSSADKNSGSASDIDFVGTPIPLKPPSPSSQGGLGSNTGGSLGGATGGGGPAGAGGMGGILAGGQAGFSPMGEGDSSFPFDITGEAYGEESEYEDSPRFRVFKIPMGSSSGGSFGAFGSSPGGGETVDLDPSKNAKIKKELNRSFYYLSSAEASLKDVPGVFRSMASGYKKSRVQNLCEKFSQLKIGLCQRSMK